MPGRRKGGDSVPVTFYVSAELHGELSDLARDLRVSQSDLGRYVLKRILQEHLAGTLDIGLPQVRRRQPAASLMKKTHVR